MRSALEDAGGHAQHAYIPYFLAGRFAPEHLITLPSTVKVFTASSDLTTLAELPDDADSFAEAWARAIHKQNQPRVIPEDAPPLVDDVVMLDATIDKEGLPSRERDIPYGADAEDTSLFMFGDVSVNVILPESEDLVCTDFTIDEVTQEIICNSWAPDSEDWTNGQLLEVESEIIGAMDWWAMRNADASITFVYNFVERTPSILESIEWDHDYTLLQIVEYLLNIGYPPFQDHPYEMMVQFINDMRDASDCDWGFLALVVNSYNDPDGMFADNKFAFAVSRLHHGGGPYLVMTYDNGGYQIDNMDAVCAHETGHVFGAADQYGGCICEGQTGYLYYENQNCVNDCFLDELSIMRGAIIPFTNGAVDFYARGQIGWQDTDGDGVHDIEDTHPLVTVDLEPLYTSPFFQVNGSCVVKPMDPINPYWATCSINTIAGVQFRINEGPWQDGTADDGEFDGPEEAFTLSVVAPGNGMHTIECRGVNNVGNYSDPIFSGIFEVYYESSSYLVTAEGNGDFPTIQDALNAVVTGDTIILADGTYLGAGNVDLDFLGKDLALMSYSGNPELCMIDCDASPGNPHRGLHFHLGETGACKVIGIGIINGYAATDGGAALCEGQSSPSFIDCRFGSNEAATYGSGLSISNDSHPMLSGCSFNSNTASWGAVYVGSGCSVTVSNSVFLENNALDGGAISSYQGTVSLTDCLFIDNEASDWGGAIRLYEATATLNRCTLVGNSAIHGAGAILCTVNSSATLTNSIIAFSAGGGSIVCAGEGVATLLCCDIYGNVGGDWEGCIASQLGIDGNISLDPMFCDLVGRDLELDSESPCAAENNPECGQIGALDVGCGETGIEEQQPQSGLFILSQSHPNPFNPKTQISFNLPFAIEATLSIFDLPGRKVKELLSSSPYEAGTHTISWNGTDDSGQLLSSGVYFYRLEAGEYVETRKMTLLK